MAGPAAPTVVETAKAVPVAIPVAIPPLVPQANQAETSVQTVLAQHVQSAVDADFSAAPAQAEALRSLPPSENPTGRSLLDLSRFSFSLVARLKNPFGPHHDAQQELAIRDEAEAPELSGLPLAQELAASLSRQARLRKPVTVNLDESSMVNAEAWAHFRLVTVTRGSLEQLDRRLLRSVLAHEIGHIRHRLTRILWRLAGMPAITGAPIFFGLWSLTTLSLTTCLILAQQVAMLMFFYMVLHCPLWEEQAADAEAVRLTKDPQALIEILRDFASADPLAPARISRLETMLNNGPARQKGH
jgi:Zn-dependent protease with chaperone function